MLLKDDMCERDQSYDEGDHRDYQKGNECDDDCQEEQGSR